MVTPVDPERPRRAAALRGRVVDDAVEDHVDPLRVRLDQGGGRQVAVTGSMSTVRPSSSPASRTTASAGDSPWSSRPPGRVHPRGAAGAATSTAPSCSSTSSGSDGVRRAGDAHDPALHHVRHPAEADQPGAVDLPGDPAEQVAQTARAARQPWVHAGRAVAVAKTSPYGVCPACGRGQAGLDEPLPAEDPAVERPWHPDERGQGAVALAAGGLAGVGAPSTRAWRRRTAARRSGG